MDAACSAPRKVQFLLSKKEPDINTEEQNFLDTFFEICPQAKQARRLALNFHTIFEKKDAKALPDWIQQAKDSGIAALKNFATGLESDYAAVETAATYHWSGTPRVMVKLRDKSTDSNSSKGRCTVGLALNYSAKEWSITMPQVDIIKNEEEPISPVLSNMFKFL